MQLPAPPGRFALASAAALVAAAQEIAPDAPGITGAAGLDFFETRIRPILVERCYECHSSGAKKLQGNLLLDSRAGWMKGGDLGAAIVPGEPEASPLVRAIRYGDEELQMPPSGRLLPQEIADLERWVELGAPDPREGVASVPGAKPRWTMEEGRKHWAFQPVRAVEPPAVGDGSWCENEIDRFVLAKLEEQGLTPAREADRRTLLRRVSFDLVGLPPTEEELAAFLADESPDAWERVIERLLASPHYGERWGRTWLDLARYADSNGLDENLALGNAWRYRDWVIAAFNADLPYDEFLLQQIAGDLLPLPDDPARRFDAIVATGFLVLGPKMLAEQDKEKLVMDVVDEQLDVLGKATMGLALGCARCHDHKFDPIPTADYYALAGVFKSTSTLASLDHVSRWRERELVTEEERAAMAAWMLEQVSAKSSVGELEARARELASAWRGDLAEHLIDGTALERRSHFVEAESFERGTLLADRETWGTPENAIVRTQGPGSQWVEYDLEITTSGPMRLEVRSTSDEARPVNVLLDGALLFENVLGMDNGDFHLAGQRWTSLGALELGAGPHVLRFERTADFPHIDRFALVPDESVTPAVRRWATFLASARRDDDAFFAPWFACAELDAETFVDGARAAWSELAARTDLDPLAAGIVAAPAPECRRELAARYQAALAAAEVALATTPRTGENGPPANPSLARVELILRGAQGPYGFSQGELEAELAREDRAELERRRAVLAQVEAGKPPAFEQALGVQDGVLADLPIHVRGSHLNLALDPEPRGALTLFDPCVPPPHIAAGTSGRMEVARWIVHPDHPLTPRVMVNRIWKGHFGHGIVRSASNFGLRGDPPSHPELLDWLARRFVASGWSVKEMHRLILRSRAWRMSSEFDLADAERDPENRLLWRQNRRRLEAELVRDALLSASGRLDLRLGGTLLTTGNGDYVTNDQSANQALYGAPRRSIYLPIIRNAMFDLFTTFDYADASVPNEVRPETTVASQALFLINSPLARESSRALAERVLAQPAADDDERAGALWRAAYGRAPSADELALAAASLARFRRASSEAATEASSVRPWQGLAQVLLASNEFLYLD